MSLKLEVCNGLVTWSPAPGSKDTISPGTSGYHFTRFPSITSHLVHLDIISYNRFGYHLTRYSRISYHIIYLVILSPNTNTWIPLTRHSWMDTIYIHNIDIDIHGCHLTRYSWILYYKIYFIKEVTFYAYNGSAYNLFQPPLLSKLEKEEKNQFLLVLRNQKRFNLQKTAYWIHKSLTTLAAKVSCLTMLAIILIPKHLTCRVGPHAGQNCVLRNVSLCSTARGAPPRTCCAAWCLSLRTFHFTALQPALEN